MPVTLGVLSTGGVFVFFGNEQMFIWFVFSREDCMDVDRYIIMYNYIIYIYLYYNTIIL